MISPVPNQKAVRSLLMPGVAELLQETMLLFWNKFLHFLNLYFFVCIGYGLLIAACVAIVYSQGFGAVLSFTGLSPILSAFHNTRFDLTIGIVSAASFVFMVMFSGWFVGAFLFMLHETASHMSVFTYLRKGAIYVMPIVTVSCILAFFILGGLFLGVLPGVLFGMLFLFVFPVVIFESRRGIDALQMSVSMIAQHRKAVAVRIFILLVLLSLQYLLVRGIAYLFHDLGIYEVYIQLTGILVIFWFLMTYVYVLYTHVRNAYDDLHPVSLTWLKSITLIGWFVGIILILQTFQLLAQYRVADLMVRVLNTGSQLAVYGKRLILIEPSLDEKTLYTINIVRATEGNIPFDQDQHLCAYAARRLQQFADSKGFDGNVAYRADLANSMIWQNYLTGFNKINSLVWERKGYPNEVEVIVGSWVKENTTETDIHIITSQYSHACVRANADFVVLVIGDRK